MTRRKKLKEIEKQIGAHMDTNIHSIEWSGFVLRKRLICKDGTSISIQGSMYHYSCPRDGVGPYVACEVSTYKYERELDNWYECPFDPDVVNVAPYVPIKIIAKMILRHGGVKM